LSKIAGARYTQTENLDKLCAFFRVLRSIGLGNTFPADAKPAGQIPKSKAKHRDGRVERALAKLADIDRRAAM